MPTLYTRVGVCRYSSHPPVLTLLLLLLLCCTVGCLAATPHGCMHCELSKKNRPTAVVREIPRKGQGAMQAYTASAPSEVRTATNTDDPKANKNWAPIRIKVFTRDLDDPSRYCTKAGDIRVDQMATKIYCRAKSVLTVRKKRIIVEQLIPAAIKMHSERISVVPLTGTVVVPRTLKGYCDNNTIPEEHFTTGLVDADVYVYLSAMQFNLGAAWGTSCGFLEEDGRPYIGSVNVDPAVVEATDENVRRLVHEIAHVLGFEHWRFMFHGIMDKVENDKVREKERIWVINTSIAKEKASEFFGCKDAPGIELESTSRCGATRSHLEMRNTKDDLMSPIGSTAAYSVLTLAVFDSMPYYKVNYSMAEPMRWGHKTGCKFLQEKCVKKGESNVPDHFCTESPRLNQNLCTTDRMAIGYCAIGLYETPLPEYYQYFSSNTYRGKWYRGMTPEMDYCPYVEPRSDSLCANSTRLKLGGSFIGPNSRCVKGEGLKYKQQDVGDVCVDTKCDHEKKKVSVRFGGDGDDDWHDCEEGNRIISNKRNIWSGKIICPKYDEVCYARPNPFVLEKLPTKPDDNEPAPANITWTVIKSEDPSPQLTPRRSLTAHDDEVLFVEGKTVAPHTSEHAGSQGSITHTVPTTGATVEDRMDNPDLHIGDHDKALDASEAKGENVQGNQDGAESAPHPNEESTQIATQNTLTNTRGGHNRDAKNNMATNGKGGAVHVLNNNDAMTLNIGIGDGSIPAAGHASLLLLILASAVTVAVSL